VSRKPISTRAREVVIRVSPRKRESPRVAASVLPQELMSLGPSRIYDAWIYAAEPVPHLNPPPDSQRIPDGYGTVGNMTLVGLEKVTVSWNRYQEYLGAFLEGETGARRLGGQLFQTFSEGLQRLFDHTLADGSGGRTVRVWWGSETPELEDMPWELMAYERVPLPPTQFIFVRGLPPDTPPLTPTASGRLRLALIRDPNVSAGPPELLAAIDSLKRDGIVDVIDYGLHPRKALRQAVAQGLELVHIVADGFVSMSYDGILYLHEPSREDLYPEMGASELMSTLLGSRVGLIGLTESRPANPDTIVVACQEVPSVYRAFACLGATRQPLPTMVAPLGPVWAGDAEGFWSGFYRGLAETLNVHKAMALGRGTRLLPFAVFLRQRFSRLFRPAGAELPSLGGTAGAQRGVQASVAMAAQMDLSQALIEEVRDLRERTGDLPAGMAAFLERESRRHAEMQQRLDPYLTSDAEEVE
jgi:hypothetical protein